MHHGVIASSILFSPHQLAGIFVFMKKENYAISTEENNYFVRVGFYVDVLEQPVLKTKNPPHSNLQKSKRLEHKLQFSRGRRN